MKKTIPLLILILHFFVSNAQQNNKTKVFTRYSSNSAKSQFDSGRLTVPTFFTGTTHQLRDKDRNITPLINYDRGRKNKGHFISAANNTVWGKPNLTENNIDSFLEAYWSAEKVYDYFEEKFNYVPFKGRELQIVGTNDSGGYYEDDNAIDVAHPDFASLDVVAHEIMHGILRDEGNHLPDASSDPREETFGDFFAFFIEHYTKNYSRVWEIGDEALSLRNAKTSKSIILLNNNYNGVLELDKWLYICVMGGRGTNPSGEPYIVNGLGFERMEKLLFTFVKDKNEFAKLGVAERMRPPILEQAKKMFGKNSIEVIGMTNAFFAVGYGEAHAVQRNTGSPIDDKAPTIVTNLSIDKRNFEGEERNISLQWDESFDRVGVRGYGIYVNDKLIGQTQKTFFAIPKFALEKGGFFSFHLIAYDLSDNLSEKSNAVTLNLPTKQEVCIPTFENEGGLNFIRFVKINNIVNRSEKEAFYNDYTDVQFTLNSGVNKFVFGLNENRRIHPTPDGRFFMFKSNLNSIFRIWIDFNQNNIFEDNEEINRQSESSKSYIHYKNEEDPLFEIKEGSVGNKSKVHFGSQFETTFTVPDYAPKNTKLRMRVSGGNFSVPGCDDPRMKTKTGTEIEDYTVVITDTNLVSRGNLNTKTPEFKIFPNPVNSYINLKNKDNFLNSEYKIIEEFTGSVVLKGLVKQPKILVTSLKKNTFYILLIEKENKRHVARFIKN